jgi:hypothetical protein
MELGENAALIEQAGNCGAGGFTENEAVLEQACPPGASPEIVQLVVEGAGAYLATGPPFSA